MKWFLTLCGIVLLGSVAAQNPAGFRMGKTTGKLPYMEYGPGDDRLGGAKMTYLDSNILVTVIDSLNTDYIIRLSQNHKAFIPKENVRFRDSGIIHPWYLSGNWKITGDNRYDYLTVNLPEKLPYRSVMHVDPARIVIDLFGITSNTNWITQLNTSKEISRAWYEQTEDDVMRIFIELRHNQHWGYQIGYDTLLSRLIVRVKRQPSVGDIKKMNIAIDAGHGGDNAGASGITSGKSEKEITLVFAKILETQLKKAGIQNVYMTRTTDTSLSMPDRILALRSVDPDFLVSLHLNSSGTDTVRGTSSYYRYIGFRPLASAIHNRMLELKLNDFGCTGSFNFALSGPTEYPNCLVEIAFLSNREDEKRILDNKFQKAVAQKIQAGIRDWLKSMNKK